MKLKSVRRMAIAMLAGIMVLGLFGGCGKTTQGQSNESVGENQKEQGEEQDEETTAGGTIVWLANMSSGIQYDAACAYAQSICDAWGYKFQIVYGDSFNDPAGNLTAVKNAMTKDVVGIIVSQDGGITNIMEEYPDLYVVGYNSDMQSVYGEGGASASCATNEKFLGTIADGHIKGEDLGKQMFDMIVEKGYNKVSTVIFPAFAYPNLTAGDATLRTMVEEYNTTAAADDKIEVVGEAKVLEFAPLEDVYFLETQNQDLDAVVAMCAGVEFVYPALKSAIDGGTIRPDTKLITSGFSNESSILEDIGGDGVIQAVTISPTENIGWSLTMLDKALTGTMFSDYSVSERFDSLEYVMDSAQDIENVMSKSLNGTADATMAQISVEELKNTASYTELRALFMSDQLTVDSLAE